MQNPAKVTRLILDKSEGWKQAAAFCKLGTMLYKHWFLWKTEQKERIYIREIIHVFTCEEKRNLPYDIKSGESVGEAQVKVNINYVSAT